jgi:two-component system, sensor histidine kinase SagS
VSARQRILYICNPNDSVESLPEAVRATADIQVAHNPLRAIARITREKFDGIYVAADRLQNAVRLGRLLENDRILEGMPDGVALLDGDLTILWANHVFVDWCNRGNVIGEQFFTALGMPDIVGAEDKPLITALKTGHAAGTLLKTGANRFYNLHAAPIADPDVNTRHLVVTLRDVTPEIQQQQKLAAIQDAGRELADLMPSEIFDMPVEARIELLKSNILHCIKDLLKFDVVEIRLIDQKTRQLIPLLEVGMDEEAAHRELWVRESANGVTGFVASTGKSYLCEDTGHDPLYLTGAKGAKSSLTVPLKLHNETIGTFNVESPEPHAFTDADLQFLQIFCRDVAMSLNTLQLLAAQRMNAAQESVEEIHRQVAVPIDEIVLDATLLTERLEELDPEMRARLEKILGTAREIKDVIQKVGRTLAPTDAVPALGPEKREKLRGKRVLVVDGDESIRTAAHSLLEPHDCVVETAQKGSEAETLFRHGQRDLNYHVVISGVKLPDMSGFDLMMRLQPMVQPVPMILSQEFGWDAGHTVVKCRQAGLHPSGTVIKPFKEKQLLDTLETIIDWSQKQADEAVGQVQPACSASSATPARHAGSGEARAAQAAPDPHGSVP